jgi:hypothetical protein
MTDYNATAAFDRVLAGLSVITCQRVGLPRVAGSFMFHLLKEMSFHLITGFGKSTDCFRNNQNNIRGQGVLQGSSSACPIYIINSDVSISKHRKLGKGAAFIHPINKSRVKDMMVQFVDVTSQFLNPGC